MLHSIEFAADRISNQQKIEKRVLHPTNIYHQLEFR